MGSMSWIHWVIVIAVVALLFGGKGKLSGLMGDAAKGIRAFRVGRQAAAHRRRERRPAPITSAANPGLPHAA